MGALIRNYLQMMDAPALNRDDVADQVSIGMAVELGHVEGLDWPFRGNTCQ